MNQKFLLSALFLSGWVTAAAAGPVESFDDLELWIGEGANQAGFIIDFDGGSDADAAFAWGFRWDGEASGEDMLQAMAADGGVYVRRGEAGEFGIPLYGLGYDANHDGQFTLNDGTTFTDGVAITGSSDGAQVTTNADLYAEGWFDAFWLYMSAADNPFTGAEWTSDLGMSDRMLTDGAWDAWVYDADFSFDDLPQNVQAAAVPEPAGWLLATFAAGAAWLLRRRGY